jgi:hypothetical protein
MEKHYYFNTFDVLYSIYYIAEPWLVNPIVKFWLYFFCCRLPKLYYRVKPIKSRVLPIEKKPLK